MLIEGRYLFFNDDKKDVLSVRTQVFQLEQNIPADMIMDEYEEEAIHAVVYADNKPVAAGRLVFDGETYRIGRVAVLKEERGNNYGDFVVRLLIDKAFQIGAKEILTSSRQDFLGFYRKIGFDEYGDAYTESGMNFKHMKLDRNSLCKNCNRK